MNWFIQSCTLSLSGRGLCVGGGGGCGFQMYVSRRDELKQKLPVIKRIEEVRCVCVCVCVCTSDKGETHPTSVG